MDRTVAPKVEALKAFEYDKAQKTILDNGIELFYIKNQGQEAIKIDLVFNAGYSQQKKPLQAVSVTNLLEEGTTNRSSEAIATAIDNEGAIFRISSNADAMELNLYCLASKLSQLLPIVLDIIENPIFPEEELKNFIDNSKQKFNINQQKVSFLVKNEFLSTLFGSNHPYSNKIEETDFDNLNREDLLWFYESFIKNKKFTIYVSGKIEEAEIQLFNQFLGQNRNLEEVNNQQDYSYTSSLPQNIYIEKPDANQVAIRLGMPTIGKNDKDFPALFFTNTLLGGFFGSRLMSNIREDKGYTYGIGSGIATLKNNSYFFITSELGVDYLTPTLKEIEAEINRLQTEEIPEKELQLVKNYLQGSVMKNFDGAFEAMNRFKSLHFLNLNYSYYDNLLKVFHQMNSQRVNEVALQYLKFEKFHTLVAGKKQL